MDTTAAVNNAAYLYVSLFFLKGIVHFEIIFWYVLANLKSIQDVGVFVSTAFSIWTFFGQTVVVCQSYNAVLGVHLKEHAQRSQN